MRRSRFREVVGDGGMSSDQVKTLATVVVVGIAMRGKSAGKFMHGPSPRISAGKQGNHQVGHNNYTPGHSVLTADPAELGRHAGTGQQVENVAAGLPGSKERVDFGRELEHSSTRTGRLHPQQWNHPLRKGWHPHRAIETITMRMTFRSKIILSVNRALLGEVFRDLAGVSCVIDSDTSFGLTFFVAREVDESTEEDVSCIETEVMADFPANVRISHSIESGRPALPTTDAFWIFLRKSE